DTLRASKAMQSRFFSLVKHGKMEPVWNSTVVDILGAERVEAVLLKGLKTSGSRVLPTRGGFPSVRDTPHTARFSGRVGLGCKGTGMTRGSSGWGWAHGRAWRESSRRGMLPTTSIGKPLPQPEPGAWRRWTPNAGWRRWGYRNSRGREE